MAPLCLGYWIHVTLTLKPPFYCCQKSYPPLRMCTDCNDLLSSRESSQSNIDVCMCIHTHTCSPLAFHECTTDWSLACNKPTAGRLAHTGFNPTGERAFLPGCVAQLTSLRAPAKSITKMSSMFIHNNHTDYSKNTLSHKKNQTVNCPGEFENFSPGSWWVTVLGR